MAQNLADTPSMHHVRDHIIYANLTIHGNTSSETTERKSS